MLVLVVGGSTGVVAAGAVDQNVAGAQILQHRLMDLFQSLGLQNVGLVAFHDVALSLHLVGQFLDGVLIQVQSSNLCAGLCKRLGHSAADQTASAGNNDNFASIVNVQGKICHVNYLQKLRNFRTDRADSGFSTRLL